MNDRKRKSNRLSAQRKRNKEQALLDNLSSSFQALESQNVNLKSQQMELRQHIMALKQFLQTKPSAVATPAHVSIQSGVNSGRHLASAGTGGGDVANPAASSGREGCLARASSPKRSTTTMTIQITDTRATSARRGLAC